MFQPFPSLGGMLDPLRPQAAPTGRAPRLRRISRILLLPMLFLAFAGGCSHHHNNASDPGTPPVITTAPVDATTVTGQPVSFTVTATGAPVLRFQWAKDGTAILGALGSTYTLYNPRVQDAGHYTVTITNPNGTITSPPAVLTIHTALNITAPMGLASDVPGNLFVSDAVGQVVWKVSPSNQVTLLAGSLGNAGSADGKGSAAQFNNPGGVAVDAAGNVLVADTGNHTLRRITPDGTVTTVAGSPGLTGTADGLGALARFNTPTGLAMSSTGAVYVSDSLNHTIRILGVDGTVSTYAGTPGQAGFNDGNARSALFDQPNGLALAANGTLYVADYGNSCLRTISPSLVVSTLAGKFNNPGFFDATGTAAQFNRPVGIALDAAGNLWVADTQNHAIRRILPSGVVNLMAGTGAAGNADGTGTTALFDLPCGILYTPGGNLLVADTANHILRSVTPVGIVTTLTVP